MSYKSNTKNNCFVIVITILLISLIINIYQAVVNNEYNKELRLQNYNRIEEIRYRNESILATLESCISSNTINNEELLTLYKNYSELAEVEVELWESYLDNLQNKIVKHNNKTVNIPGKNKNEIYWEIEELVYSYLKNDMKENTFAMELNGKVLTDFQILRDMALDINNYFINFYSEKCTHLSDEKKKEKMIKENYWVDILEGIQEVTNEYIDYAFIY